MRILNNIKMKIEEHCLIDMKFWVIDVAVIWVCGCEASVFSKVCAQVKVFAASWLHHGVHEIGFDDAQKFAS